MKILVINGSPKGNYSSTLYTSLFLEKVYNEHIFSYINVAQKIKSLEKDMTHVISKIKESDLIIFSYPVYTFICPSQLHLFISLLKRETNKLEELREVLRSKYVTQISTSKHFYDVTAHKYIEENTKDLQMKYIKGLSADMDDILTEKGQNEAKLFFEYVLFSIKNNYYEKNKIYQGTNVRSLLKDYKELSIEDNNKKNNSNEIVIVTDIDNNPSLEKMVNAFRVMFPYRSKLINLRDFPFKGGCLGCFNCATDGKCIYKDHFDDFLRNEIQNSGKIKAIVYAFTIKDHSMGPLFKMYDDRQFCNGHRTVTMGTPMGYIIDGDYEREDNLKMIIEGRCEVGGNYLVKVASNEYNPDDNIKELSDKLVYSINNHMYTPRNFYGVGGMKIFRDLIYLMRGMMKADHKFFKKNNQYDFPQKKKGLSFKMKLVGLLLSNKKIKAKMGNKLIEGMIGPYKKALEKINIEKK